MRRIAVLAAAGLLSACQTASGQSEQAPAPLAVPDAVDALGTEPFWAVMVDADQIALTRPDHPPATGPNSGPTRTATFARWETKTGQGKLKLTVTAGPCSDGMSDRTYPFSAQAVIAGRTLKGCAAEAGARGER
ncbi:COG3650 family protein [Caulobacter sp. NIBR2454]|uniref:COG3650 family protein n=1 Tax=Caulobacter sp. NIBR2454 TaxID=3015996 RepID=UPI0022B682FC|nr:hypothetical protein [Caulobacter sp. NIBR2454]